MPNPKKRPVPAAKKRPSAMTRAPKGYELIKAQRGRMHHLRKAAGGAVYSLCDQFVAGGETAKSSAAPCGKCVRLAARLAVEAKARAAVRRKLEATKRRADKRAAKAAIPSPSTGFTPPVMPTEPPISMPPSALPEPELH